MKLIVLCFISVLILAGPGCATTHTLPRESKIVGGGLDIGWTAPYDGTAILIEKKTHKVIATKSLAEGETFEFNPSKSEDDMNAIKAAFGETTPHASNFILYFAPKFPTTAHSSR